MHRNLPIAFPKRKQKELFRKCFFTSRKNKIDRFESQLESKKIPITRGKITLRTASKSQYDYCQRTAKRSDCSNFKNKRCTKETERTNAAFERNTI